MRPCQDDSATINRTIWNRMPKGKLCSVSRHTPQLCLQCGYSWPHKKTCPAQGKQSAKCGKNNHFAQVCRSRIAARQRRSEKPSSAKQVVHVLKLTLQTTPAWMTNTCILWLRNQHSKMGPLDLYTNCEFVHYFLVLM